jgi:hypothetical protein
MASSNSFPSQHSFSAMVWEVFYARGAHAML